MHKPYTLTRTHTYYPWWFFIPSIQWAYRFFDAPIETAGAAWGPIPLGADMRKVLFLSILYELIQVDYQIRQRWGAYLPDLRERNGANLLHVSASVPCGAPISPCALDLVGRADLAALEASQSSVYVGNPEQYASMHALRGGQSSCAYKTQEPGRADNLADRVLGEQNSAIKSA